MKIQFYWLGNVSIHNFFFVIQDIAYKIQNSIHRPLSSIMKFYCAFKFFFFGSRALIALLFNLRF